MSGIKRMLCLANSRKLAGRCIAGREWLADQSAGNWLRPVSDRPGQEVSEYERQYEDGSDPKVLDIIDVPVKRPHPEGFQTENWLLDSEYYWRKVGSCSPLELSALADPVEPLWNDGHSTYHGINDRIPIEAAETISGSLRLIGVNEVVLQVFAPGEAFGNSKRRVQGRFAYSGRNYAFWVTDPLYERRYLAKIDGIYRIGECHLTISLGEPFQDAVYKLIAAVIELDGRS